MTRLRPTWRSCLKVTRRSVLRNNPSPCFPKPESYFARRLCTQSMRPGCDPRTEVVWDHVLVKWMSNRTIMKDIRRLYIDQMLNRRRGVTFTHKWWLTIRSILIKLVILYIYICNLENGFLVIDYLIFGYLMTIVY